MIADSAVIDAIITQLKKYDCVEKALLFGSRARGDCSEKSDYDIAVYGYADFGTKAELKSYCDEYLPTLHKIDLVFVNDVINRKLLQNIKNDGILIYEKVAK